MEVMARHKVLQKVLQLILYLLLQAFDSIFSTVKHLVALLLFFLLLFDSITERWFLLPLFLYSWNARKNKQQQQQIFTDHCCKCCWIARKGSTLHWIVTGECEIEICLKPKAIAVSHWRSRTVHALAVSTLLALARWWLSCCTNVRQAGSLTRHCECNY